MINISLSIWEKKKITSSLFFATFSLLHLNVFDSFQSISFSLSLSVSIWYYFFRCRVHGVREFLSIIFNIIALSL